MRFALLASVAVAAGCNALTGAGDLVVGGQEITPSPTDDAAIGEDGGPEEDVGVVSLPDAAADAALDAPFDAPADGGPPTDAGPLGKRVFVTSASFNGAFGGLAAADAICTARASAANLGGSWVAWLSDSATPASGRVGNGPWQLTTGKVAATSASALMSQLDRAIDRDENQALTTHAAAWTGTADGMFSNASCGDWTNPAAVGTVGSTSGTMAAPGPGSWTAQTSQACASELPFYCFEK